MALTLAACFKTEIGMGETDLEEEVDFPTRGPESSSSEMSMTSLERQAYFLCRIDKK